MKCNVRCTIFFVWVIVFAWTGSSPVLAGDVKILHAAGCKTEYFLLKDLADAYNKNTGNKLQLGNTGNKKAVKLLLADKIDFAFTCKPIKTLSAKLKLEKDVVESWQSVPIARDPIVVVTHVENGVENITKEQLTELFRGNIKNWKELGGNDYPVLIAYINPELESGITLLFKEFTVGSSGTLDETARLANSPSMLGNFVSLTPGAVTFMGFNSYVGKYGSILEIDSIAPTKENILSGKYGLSATYYITQSGNKKEDVDEFVHFVLSDVGTATIEKNFIAYVE